MITCQDAEKADLLISIPADLHLGIIEVHAPRRSNYRGSFHRIAELRKPRLMRARDRDIVFRRRRDFLQTVGIFVPNDTVSCGQNELLFIRTIVCIGDIRIVLPDLAPQKCQSCRSIDTRIDGDPVHLNYIFRRCRQNILGRSAIPTVCSYQSIAVTTSSIEGQTGAIRLDRSCKKDAFLTIYPHPTAIFDIRSFKVQPVLRGRLENVIMTTCQSMDTETLCRLDSNPIGDLNGAAVNLQSSQIRGVVKQASIHTLFCPNLRLSACDAHRRGDAAVARRHEIVPVRQEIFVRNGERRKRQIRHVDLRAVPDDDAVGIHEQEARISPSMRMFLRHQIAHDFRDIAACDTVEHRRIKVEVQRLAAGDTEIIPVDDARRVDRQSAAVRHRAADKP